MRRLDIGIASYGKYDKLAATVRSIQVHTRSDWRLFIIDNPGPDPRVRDLIAHLALTDARIVPVYMPSNARYVGAVNRLFELAQTDYIAYCDDDVEIQTPGWDDSLISVMENNPEVGWMFPGPGHYGFHNGRYRECLWNAGYCWILRREAMLSVVQKRPADDGKGGFDSTLGHHEEVDYMIRLRLSGWRVGCVPEVTVIHHESATRRSEEDHKPGGRIHDGVVRWMNKWNHYFCGDELQYSMTAYDPRALRYTDWNVDALYLERMTLAYFPELNANPPTIQVPGVGPMQIVGILKPMNAYVRRAI